MIMELWPWEGPHLHDHDVRVGCRLRAGFLVATPAEPMPAERMPAEPGR